MRRSHAIGSVLLLVVALSGGCRQAPAPEVAAPPQPAPAVAATSLAIVAVSTDPEADRPAALLAFDRPLAQGQPFDELLAITVKDGAAPEGSWALDDDGQRLRFPYLAANTQYVVSMRAALAAADGSTLGEDASRELYTGPLEPLAGFASQGSVLPAHESRGLPVVTVNVTEVDLEFLRVRERALPAFLAEYQRSGRRSYWSLDELSRHAEPVYANRFALESRPNERTLSYIPVRDLDQLREPGLYFAVLKRPGTYASQYETAMFFVSDLGVHVRAYGSRMLVHVASLESGRPRAGVELSLRGKDAAVVASATTDDSGLATLEAKPDPAQVLLASFGRDLSLLSFRQPALDLSEFAVAGRPWRAVEIFPWSGRDLYRPGETLRVSALLRDDDGKAMPGQPLVATLRQPDGRAVVQAQLEPGALGYYEWSREIARDAPTGRWSVDFASDPAQSDAAFAFRFRVEEFLPERLKLEIAAEPQTLVPGDALPLAVDAAYLHGAPAAGNRFTAQLALALEQHPVASLPDFVFGDALVELPKAPQDVIDAVLDPQGRLREDVALPEGSGKATPVRVVIAGSVYETGGRAVSRSLSRTIWPAPALVGVRPLFDLADGAAPGGNAGFEVIRSDAAGTLLAAEGLKTRLVREIRDWSWRWDDGEGWRTDYTQRFETLDERTLAIAAGGRAELSLPVDWGGYRLEIDDPSTGLTLRLPFQAGWSADDANRGAEARPDKVKLALDQPAYRGGDTLKVTLTPPHPGPALLLLEGDALLWHRTLDARAGTVVEIPLDPAWERHDLYLSALVFRPGSEAARVTPKRALGVVHVPIDRSARRIAATLAAPASMRPGNPLEVEVSAPQLAGQVAAVRVTAVDLGVLNITRFPLPDAADWFFAPRRLGVEARDLYARVIESLDGAKARLRYGGDAALLALPQARRPDAGVRTVDLYHAPVSLDAQGKARVSVPVPDFNGTLRVRALVYGADRYGAAEGDTLVRAPLVAEASLPRVMAPGDRSQLTLDLTNLSDADGEFEVRLRAEGPLALERESARVALADGAKRTLDFGLRARDAFGSASVVARISGPGVDLERRFPTIVRPPWPAVARSIATVQDVPAPLGFDRAMLAGLYPESVSARLTLGTLPPLPFALSASELLDYPYGCLEQTTSKAWALVLLDATRAERLGLPAPVDAERAGRFEATVARLAAMQADNGHFAMWPGSDWTATQLTPYVVDLLLDAREAGFSVPEPMLERALARIGEDLLSGGNPHYEFDHAEHLRLAEMAYGGYVLARVQRAPVGSLRALYDNERARFESGLPLVQLGAALVLMGDQARGAQAVAEAFDRSWTRPDWLGDFGSPLRDLAAMLAIAQQHDLAQPAHAAQATTLARELLGRDGSEPGERWISTQEHAAILRLGAALLDAAPRSFAATWEIAGAREVRTGQALVSRAFDPAAIAAGVRLSPAGDGPLYALQDVTGVPRTHVASTREDLRIQRRWYRTDGSAFEGGRLREGEVLVAALRVESSGQLHDALVVDLVPGGLEIENLNLSDARQWDNVTIDGVTLSDRANAADTRYEEYRDDRYVAALRLYGGSPGRLFYLLRAVSPGEFVVPPPVVEDMYRPALRASGTALPARITVAPPGSAP